MADLKVELEEREGALVVKISGDCGVTAIEALEREMGKAAARHPNFAIFDLSGLTFISSLGMGTLMAFHRTVWQRGGVVRVASTPKVVSDAFHRAQLDKVFTLRPTVEDALKDAPKK